MGGVDWVYVYDAVASMSSWCDLGFILFIIFMVFVMLNIISGVFIERAFTVINHDRDFWMLEEAHAKKKYQNRVLGLFHEMDEDASGEVNYEEFQDAIANPHVQAYLSFIGLETGHLADIFRMIDADNSGSIQLDELVPGIEELKGGAMKVEVLRLERLMCDLVDRLGMMMTENQNLIMDGLASARSNEG